MLRVVEDKRKGMALLTGKLDHKVFEAVREMPGRKRWVDRDLLFEVTRANVEHLQSTLPDIDWQINRADAVKRLQQLEEDARRFKTRELPPEATNFQYKTKPRDHQVKSFMVSRDREAFALFLEQGLGKTKIGLDTAAYMWASGKIDTLLIDAPNGVHKQWIEEQLPVHLPDWVPHKALVYKSEQTKTWHARAEEVLAYQDGLRIIAIHHDAFSNKKGIDFAKRVLSSGKVLWIIDESSRKIKTPGSLRTKSTMSMRGLSTARRIMDGTPVTKGIEDLYTQLKFLSDDVHGFNSFLTFRNRYCITAPVPGAPAGVVNIVGYRNLEEFQRRLDGWSIRLRSQDCLDLPERIYSVRHVEMTSEQRSLYTEMREEMVAQLDTGEIVSVEQAIVRLLRLQQILCGHVKTDDGVVRSISSNRASEALATAEQIGEKVIVWARFHHDIDTLAEKFKSWNPVTWDGRTSADQRKGAKDKFINDKSCGAFIANPGSAGIGTDGLQHASHSMIYYSNTFKASERWQSEARLFRDGQKGTVNVTDLVVPGTVDMRFLQVLKERKDIAVTALDIRTWFDE